MGKHVYEVRDATLEDAKELAPRLRQADLDEVRAACDHGPEEALVHSIKNSRFPKAGLVDGELVCLFGVGSNTLLSTSGSPWLLGSDKIVKHARAFLKGSRIYLRDMKEEYGYLVNYVDARNTHSVRWLKWLGFEISKPVPFGPYGVLFHKFEIQR